MGKRSPREREQATTDPAPAGPCADSEVLPVGVGVGEYVVSCVLGEGGFGRVYLAEHPIIGKRAAIKVLSTQYSASALMVARFIEEARAVNTIHHPNIVDIFSFGVLPDGRHYYVMEYLEGMPLDRLLQREGALSAVLALPILRGVARALDATHAAGIIHRDLKPENLFVVTSDDGAPTAKLLDFGIAKLARPHAAAGTTVTGSILGTPAFMSPEQIRNQAVDPRADVYSLGVVAYLMLSGALPFDSPEVVDLMHLHLHAPPPAISERFPFVAASFDEPLLRMMAKDKERRFTTAGEAVDALELAACAAGVGFTPPQPAGRTPNLDALARSNRSTIGESTTHVGAGPGRTSGRSWRFLTVLSFGAIVPGLLAAAWPSAGRVASAHGDPNLAPPAATSPPLVDEPSPLAPAMSSEAQPDEVAISVFSVPKDAAVFLGQRRLGATGASFRFPRGATPLTLTLRAEGYQPTLLRVLPSESATLTATLPRIRAARVAAAAVSAPRDLELPY